MIALGSPALVLSAVRRSARDTLIVRCYNITSEVVTSTITCGLPVADAYCVDLAERRQGTLALSAEGQVSVRVTGGQVITVEFVPQTQEG